MSALVAVATVSTGQETAAVSSTPGDILNSLDLRALLESGRDAKSLPACSVVRLHADAGIPVPVDTGQDADTNTQLKEFREFTAGHAQRVVSNRLNGRHLLRREKTLGFDTTDFCGQLLDGKIFKSNQERGRGKAVYLQALPLRAALVSAASKFEWTASLRLGLVRVTSLEGCRKQTLLLSMRSTKVWRRRRVQRLQ